MISPDPSAVFRRLEDGGGALNVETDAHYQANASGRSVWETVQKGSGTPRTRRGTAA